MNPPRIRTGKQKPQLGKKPITPRPAKPTRSQIARGNKIALAAARGV